MTARKQISQLGKKTFQATLPLKAAGTADEVVVLFNNFGQTIKITSATFVSTNAITGDNTNYMGLALRNKGTDGSGTTAVTSTKSFTSGVDATALDGVALTLSTTTSALLIPAGAVLALNKTEAGTGMALEGVISLEYVFDSVAD